MSRKRILVLHLAGRYPLGGVGWQALHHVVGLTRLGHEAYYVEDSGAPPYDPEQRSVVEDPVRNVGFVRQMMESVGLGDRWAYLDLARGDCYGLSASRLRKLYAGADALLNLCGATQLREEHLDCPVRIYVETDPVHEQIKLVSGNSSTEAFLDAHTHHVTYGEALGTPACPIPLEKFTWTTTRPPVVLELWPGDPSAGGAAFTSVATWRNVGKDVEFRGERYTWSKHVNFERFQELPLHTAQPFELAIEADDPAVAPRLRDCGWRLINAYEVSRDVHVYRDFIVRSRGEFTVAKDLYARTQCGWFSDRSASYLAAGRPVITQSTGFERFVPTGRGLFAFQSMDEILAALDAINTDYRSHASAAHELAVEYFSSHRLLARMLRDAGV